MSHLRILSNLRCALVVLGGVGAPFAAVAEPNPMRELLKVSCTGDYLEHCSMHAPGGPEVEACFRTNIRRLSPACAQAINAYKREKKSTRSATGGH